MRLRVLVIGMVALAACGGSDERGDASDADEISPAARGTASGDAATGGATAATPSTRPRRAVLFVGTSLTAGYGLDPSEAYPAVLQRMADSAGFDVEMINAGSSGETSAGAAGRIGWLLDRYGSRVDVVVVETGANDGLRALDPEATRRNLDRVVATVRERVPDARVLLVQMEAPPNLGTRYTERFRSMFPDVARKHGAEVLPFLLEGVAGIPAMNLGDGIHPSPAGARRVAENLWPGIRAALEAERRERGRGEASAAGGR